MRPREWDATLYELAERQLGYFTAVQAREAGIHPVRLVQLANRGDLEHVSRGVYRLTRYPLSPLGQYMEASLWPQVRRPDVRAIVSHESALALHSLSHVSPSKVHITLPTALRLRRAVPRHMALHYADLAPHDVQTVEGVLVTTPARSIRDAAADHLGSALVRQAIDDGRRTGQLTLAEVDTLRRELLGVSAADSETAARRKPSHRRKPRQ